MTMHTNDRAIVNVRVGTPWLLHTRDVETSLGENPDHVVTISDYPILTYIEGTTDELRRFVAALAALVDELDR